MYTTKIPRDAESSRFSKMPSSIQLTFRAVVLALGAISVVNASQEISKTGPGAHAAAASITTSSYWDLPAGQKITVTGDVDKRIIGSYTENVWSDFLNRTIFKRYDNSTYTKDDDPNVTISEGRKSTKQRNVWTISVGGVPYFKAENRIIRKRVRKRIDHTIPYEGPICQMSKTGKIRVYAGRGSFKMINYRLGHKPPCKGWTACDKKYGNGASLKLEGDGVSFADKRSCRDCGGKGKVCETTLKARWLCSKWHYCTIIDCPKCEDGIIYGASKDS